MCIRDRFVPGGGPVTMRNKKGSHGRRWIQTELVMQGTTRVVVRSLEHATTAISEGVARRNLPQTQVSPELQRSHVVFRVHVSQSSCGSSLLTVVDLASPAVHRLNDGTGHQQRFARKQESRAINKSHQLLVECCRGGRIPVRESILTQLMSSMFLGTGRSAVLTTYSPSTDHLDDSIATARTATRVFQNLPSKPAAWRFVEHQMWPRNFRDQVCALLLAWKSVPLAVVELVVHEIARGVCIGMHKGLGQLRKRTTDAHMMLTMR
eukprot:TRINITY_DN49820_c0_g1_i2.p1 TRINITY_DN49820_c0_g1~~TRINITY_DN49820_c0_g1_i2.p1  ORF type:complete len:265 (-),score=44.66 TRINITY_DN49820_c0_g1_i2:67-861(-)